ncbi:MAG: dcm [Crocinitomicaceae bacterium]|jgi:DNA (cytosine-5)-methyltransferase 1|nr:dcm [Crocinitomicaceae bacterium]
MRVVDLFAGVGGLSFGFAMANFETVFAIEHDESIASTYKLNHPNTDVFSTDIQTLNIDDLAKKYKNVDVVIGGPPCQGFSQKGKRLSLDDERNYLFKYFIEFVKAFEPKYFLLENVPNITTTSNGFFKNEIICAFNDLGYEVDVDILTASNFGVPQNRKRAFFLGKRGTEKLLLPKTNNKKTSIADAIYDLPKINSGEGKEVYNYPLGPLSDYQKLMRKGSKGIYNHQATKHSELALKKLSMIPKGKGKEVLPEEYRTKSIYSGTWSRLKEDEFAPTITTRFDTPSSGMFTHPILDRCITVREGARLQSFPDRFIFYGTKSSQLKQVGNAVPPLLAYSIAKIIKRDNDNEFTK